MKLFVYLFFGQLGIKYKLVSDEIREAIMHMGVGIISLCCISTKLSIFRAQRQANNYIPLLLARACLNDKRLHSLG